MKIDFYPRYCKCVAIILPILPTEYVLTLCRSHQWRNKQIAHIDEVCKHRLIINSFLSCFTAIDSLDKIDSKLYEFRTWIYHEGYFTVIMAAVYGRDITGGHFLIWPAVSTG